MGDLTKYFVRGDVEGFFALALDNLITLLLVGSFCLGLLGFSPALFYQHILPATAVSLAIGNLYYARLARRLGEQENRTDACALPYGVNLFTVVNFTLFVMVPAQQAALANGVSKETADLTAWHAGIAACMVSAVIEIIAAFWADHIRRIIPQAAMLAGPAMIGLLLLSGDFFFKACAHPLIGFTTMALVLGLFYGRMKLRGNIPIAFLVLVVGTVVAWVFYRHGSESLVPVGTLASDQVGLHLPIPVLSDLRQSLSYIVPYLSVTIPVGLINLMISLQSLELAASAGDNYPGTPVLVMNGLGTLGAAVCGSPFTTTVYFGHPGWKAMGARAGYSTLNAVFFTAILLTGTVSYIIYAIPMEAGMALLVWIGAIIFVQGFNAVPAKHYPGLTIGMLPVVGGFAALVIRDAVGATNTGFSKELLSTMTHVRNFAAEGVFTIDAGYIFMSVLWAGATVCLVERAFVRAAVWMIFAAAFSALGLMHSYHVTHLDVFPAVEPAWQWVWSYLAMAGIFLVIPWMAKPDDSMAH